MASNLVDVPTSSSVQGEDDLANVKLQTLKPTPAEEEAKPAQPSATSAEMPAVAPEQELKDIQNAIAEPRDALADRLIADSLELLASEPNKTLTPEQYENVAQEVLEKEEKES